eukprot:Skav212636  [mRNA]  locus=scaffold173:381255:385333:- [translate_table: standard]
MRCSEEDGQSSSLGPPRPFLHGGCKEKPSDRHGGMHLKVIRLLVGEQRLVEGGLLRNVAVSVSLIELFQLHGGEDPAS